jgi:putative ABC transport system substrate-binding protein
MAGALGLGLAVGTRAQPRSRPARVALVLNGVPSADMTGPEPTNAYVRAFVHGLRDRGYVEGRDVVLERRATEGHPERLPAFMEELVTLRVDVIVTAGPGVQAAASATDTIPIVANVDDPVALGMTATLARPSRNVTGVTDTPDLSIHSKRLQLLKEVAASAKRVAVLDFKYVDSQKTPGTHARRLEIETTARQLGVTLIAAGADNVNELDRALAVGVTEHADALIEMGTPATLAGKRAIVEFAARNRLPAVYSTRDFVDIGGLLSYGANSPAIFGRMAEYVDKILRGAKVIDLPFEHPTAFELLVNMKTANALGIAMPQSVLLQASEVIR